MMKKIFFLGLLGIVLSNALQGQTSDSLQIDSVLIDNILFLPDPDSMQQTADQVIGLTSREIPFRAVSNMPVGVNNVYWRVSFDYDDDGDFYEIETPFGNSILYESGAIPTGSTPNIFLIFQNLDSLPPNALRTLRVEVAEDPADFGTDDSNIFNIQAAGPGDRVTSADKSTGGKGTRGEEENCKYFGVLQEGILESYVYNWRLYSNYQKPCTATIQFEEAEIYTLANSSVPCKILYLSPGGTDAANIAIETSTTAFGSSSIFTLEVGEKAGFKIILPTYCLPSTQISKIKLKITYMDCESASSVRVDSICFGCIDKITYSDHSSNPASLIGITETQLPRLTYADQGIEMFSNVTTLANDSTELVVNDNGYISAKGGTWVQQGGYFWAHKEKVCPLDTLTSTTAVFEEEKEEIDVFNISPNPTYEVFNLEVELVRNSRLSIVLYDLMGRQQLVFMKQKLQSKGKHNYSVDFSKLEAGLYYCQVIIEGKIYTKNIVKLE